MTDLQVKQLALLDDTVAHYNSTNRGIIVNNKGGNDSCHYSPSATSEGCSIGRQIKDKKLCKKFDLKKNTPVELLEGLPEELLEYGLPFLRVLQRFHDSNECWNENGLTEVGKENYEIIKSNYKLN